jgi:uncharacterized protein (TIGR02444 family)
MVSIEPNVMSDAMPDHTADDTPFWRFSLAVYAANGVADECLELQEGLGLDVNLLLFAAFAGSVEGMQLNAQDVAAAAALVEGWHTDIVRTLRAVRRTLKPMSLDDTDPLQGAAAALRTQVKTAELDAEKIEQTMLWRWSRRQLDARNRTPRDAALTANLHAMLAYYDPAMAHEAVLPRLRAAALAFESVKS